MFRLPYFHRSRPAVGSLSGAERELAVGLRRDVEVLATDIGPRGTFAPDRYRLAEEFLTASLQNMGYAVSRLESPAIEGVSWNLEVTIPGVSKPREILVVGAHYDSMVNCPAANDNGSGVAATLAMARAFSGRKLQRTLRFVLFANEEPPHFNVNAMGSQHYAKTCRMRGDNIVGMVCMETIGCYSNAPKSQTWPALPGGVRLPLPTTGDFIAFVGPTHAAPLIRQSCRAFRRQSAFPLLGAAVPSVIQQVNWSDHRGFNEVGFQGFMVTDTAPLRYAHYHKVTDTPEKLDYESMARVVRGCIGMVGVLAGG